LNGREKGYKIKMGDPREGFIQWSRDAWRQDAGNQTRLDEATEEQRIDSIKDPRERFQAGSVFLGKYGRLPGRREDSSSVDRLPDESPRDAFIRRSQEIGGHTRMDAAGIAKVHRLDSINLCAIDFSSVQRMDKATVTAQGFLSCPAFITRAGIFEYRDEAGKIRRELRPESEVFSQESMDTLKLLPITRNHEGSMITVDNIKAHHVGTTGEIIQKDGDYIQCQVKITDRATIDDIQNGRISGQISAGYDADVLSLKGTWRGQSYDAVQKSIKYNHISIVPQGRAGGSVRLLV
jgi:hypothetical protein